MGGTSSTFNIPPENEFLTEMVKLVPVFEKSNEYGKLSPNAKSLWQHKKNTFFVHFVYELRSERRLSQKLALLKNARIRLAVNPTDGVLERDMKLRQQKLACNLSEESLLEIDRRIIADGNNLFKLLTKKLELFSNPQAILKEYFSDFKFIKERLRARFLLDGRSEEDVEEEVTKHEMFYTGRDEDGRRQFDFPMRLLIVSTRRSGTLASKIGRAFSFMPSVNLQYGAKHLAIQLGYLVIHWLDDSLVHIDLLSSRNVMAMIYPQYPATQKCVKQLTEDIEESFLSDVAELIAKYNTRVTYDKVNYNCQRFATESLHVASLPPNWFRNGPIRKYIEAVATETVDPQVPLHFWTIEKGTLVEHKFHSVDQFKQWCRDNKINEMRWTKGLMTVEHENFEICKALWRAGQLKHMSGNEESSSFSRASSSLQSDEYLQKSIDDYFQTDEAISVLSVAGITVGFAENRAAPCI